MSARTLSRIAPPRSPTPVTAARHARPALGWLTLNVTVGDVMSRRPTTIGADATLMDALVTLRGNRFSGLPVVEPSGKVVGILSERDIARVIAGALSRRRVKALLDVLMVGLTDLPESALRQARSRLEETTVAEAMSSPPYVVRPDAPLELAAEVMTENLINRLPVVENDRLVGIVTRNDLIHAMVFAKK